MDLTQKTVQNPPVVTWRITSRCNNNCAYCYGPDKDVAEMDLKEIGKMLKMFKKMGVKVIDLTGGEPLMRKEFREIVLQMRSMGFDIFIDTNGDYFFENNYQDLIVDAVKGIGLTVDFPDESQRYKIPGNLGRVLKILQFLKQKKSRPIIRVATVVTSENKDKLCQIGELISKYDIDLWKVYQFIPQNTNALMNRKRLEISIDEFDDATRNLETKFGHNFKVVISKMEDRDSCYFFVGSDGKMIMPVQRGDIFESINLGYIFDPDIVDKWRKAVSEEKFIQNTEVSQKYSFKE